MDTSGRTVLDFVRCDAVNSNIALLQHPLAFFCDSPPPVPESNAVYLLRRPQPVRYTERASRTGHGTLNDVASLWREQYPGPRFVRRAHPVGTPLVPFDLKTVHMVSKSWNLKAVRNLPERHVAQGCPQVFHPVSPMVSSRKG